MNTQDLAAQLYDIYPMMHVPFWQTTWFLCFMYALVMLIIAVGIWVLYRWYKKRRDKKTIWEQAIHDINAAYQRTDVTRAKEFYTQLLILLKQYLHARYGFPVLSKTDYEMIEYIQNTPEGKKLVTELASIVEGGELIKFANATVIKEVMHKDYLRSIAIINKTIPTTTR